jgi:hypothetical protein
MDNNTNKDIGYISYEDLVFSPEKDIQSGGFSVSSIMMKSGISPIMTMNNNTENIMQNGGSNKVSDLFQNLAVPNWTTMYNMKGGEYKEQDKKKHNKEEDSDSDIDDDLHDKLLDLVKEHDHENKTNKMIKKNNKSKRKNKLDKKNTTRRKKIIKKEEDN